MPRTYTQLYIHIIFATKQRLPFIRPDLRDALYPFLGGAVRNHGGTALAIGGMPDHVHLLTRIRSRASVAGLVKSLKGSSSKWINDQRILSDHFGWQEGYAAFSVSPSQLDRVRRYIENQEEHHRDMSTDDELTRLVKKSEARG